MKLVVGTALFALLISGLAIPTEAKATDDCREGIVLKTADLPGWNKQKCEVGDVSVALPDGRVAEVPDPGWSATLSAVVAVGFEPVPDVTVARSEDGTVAVVVGEVGASEATVFGDAAAVKHLAATEQDSTVVPMSTNPKCNNYSYNAGPAIWVNTFKWYRKSGISIPQASLAGGINAMANGTGTCSNRSNGATASYQGTTTRSATISTSNLCLGTDLVNVVDTGTLPTGTLAATCTYENSSEISYADVRFNTKYSWYTGSSVTGCSGSKYDAQGIMTHEAGHVFGLGHVAQSSLQVMKPASDVCETDQRLLGPGDLAGMKYLYP